MIIYKKSKVLKQFIGHFNLLKRFNQSRSILIGFAKIELIVRV